MPTLSPLLEERLRQSNSLSNERAKDETYLNRRLLSTTLTLEKAINALAHIGVIWKSTPKIYNTPAANGMQTML